MAKIYLCVISQALLVLGSAKDCGKTTTKVIEEPKRCKNLCATDGNSWSEKCTWKHCKKCGECKTLTTEPPVVSTSTMAPITTTRTSPASTTLLTTSLTPTLTSTTKSTTIGECGGDVELDFGKATLTHHNLGGLGPDTGLEGMRFAGIGEHNGQEFDLLITSTNFSSNFPPFSGLGSLSPQHHAKFGFLFINRKTAVHLHFQIVQTGTTTPFKLPKFYFTFYDIDADADSKGQEKLTVSGLHQHIVSPNTDLVISRSDGQVSFQGTKLFGADESSTEPTDPDVMTTAQQNAAVTLLFVDTAEFAAIFESLPGTTGSVCRHPDGKLALCGEVADDLYFSGKSQLSSLHCETTAAPTSTAPLATSTTLAPLTTLTTTRVIEEQKRCKSSCATDGNSWSKKCTWKDCKRCAECSSTEIQGEGKCKSWCASDNRDWATKCTLRRCKSCSQCDKDRRLLSGNQLLATSQDIVLV